MKDPVQFIKECHLNNILARNIQTFGNTVKEEKVYGAVSKIAFKDLDIEVNFMPVGKSRTQRKLQSVEYIVVHDTGNNNLGANGFMHGKYLETDPNVSWHFTVDSKGVYQHLPEDEVGFHAGDGLRPFGLIKTNIKATTENPVVTISEDGYYIINGEKSEVLAPLAGDRIANTSDLTPSGIITDISNDGTYLISETYYNQGYKKIANQGGGTHGIGIESCVDEGSDLYATWQNLAKLVAHLLIKHHLGLNRVMQHNNFSGKNCPQTLRTANLWDYFLKLVKAEYLLQKEYSEYQFTLQSNCDLIDQSGKIVKAPENDTNIFYKVIITNNQGYYQEVNFESKIMKI